mgnify:FL=1
MKKLFGCILSLVVAVMLVFTPAEHVYAQGLGLSVSSSSVAVGKTVKVTVSMPSGYFGTVVISSSDEGVLSNGGDGVANIGDAAGYPTSQSFSFTAKAAGSCTIKAYCTVVGDAEGNDAGGTITGASTKVTVKVLHQTMIQTATRITRTIPAAIPAMTTMQIKIMKTKRKRNPQTHLLVRLLSQQVCFPLSFLLRQRITQLQ